MGYGVYYRNGRWGGYGVPAPCDQPECDHEIDRGLSYICGEDPSPEKGCGLAFCANHLFFTTRDGDPQMCERCCDDLPPFEPKPDLDEWVAHMLTDDSWQQWRDENPDEVARLREAI